MTFTDFVKIAHARTEQALTQYLKTNAAPTPRLQEAIEYSVLNSGKRIRPLLVYLAGRAFAAPWENLDAAACAIELIHSYSLVHDDLPAMDNADLRRGKPSCHKAFDEAFAILAGDALQPLAIEIIAKTNTLSPEQRLNMITTLTHASGIQGMIGGQALDMMGAKSLSSLTTLYQLKTGALLSACIKLAAIAANIKTAETLTALETYATNLGLAFQIQDDLLDIQATTAITGKPQGIDTINNKITYPVLAGLTQTLHMIESLFKNALHSLDRIGEQTILLKEFAYFLLQRQK